MRSSTATAIALLFLSSSLAAQQAKPKGSQDLKGFTVPDEPANPQPAASVFRDSKYHVTYHIPAGWDTERKDGVLSDLEKDVRSATSSMRVRGVSAINYNPYPPTTFSGALFYFSVVPNANAQSCSALATTGKLKPKPDVTTAGITFKHGQDQHGGVCTESRNEVFTTLKGNTCLRFDLVVNTFCGESSGAVEMNSQQLGDVNTRLANILGSIQIDR
ncbi:hypothetical protein [Terriglobus roseus]|uniref:Uncharacterized protein n=1 Tax=Terriglobus roseus TaxID=392734 RepID=A0A1G7KEB0_9BACT|nr:hypothetical protein [Terriglobus roseus]SDF35608.1 hypothetical protein SAMN05444167_2156 [Terriglobus roseus]